jgi:uncharacterized protein YndB with AHSA1/START domain
VKAAIQSSIIIDRSPEGIARFLLDPETAPLWNSGLDRFEVLSQVPGLVGSRARLHYVQVGKRYVMEDELLEVEPNRRVLSRVSGGAIVAEVETLLIPTKGGTLVTVRWFGRGRRLIPRLVLPLMRTSIASRTLADLQNLKKLLESD